MLRGGVRSESTELRDGCLKFLQLRELLYLTPNLPRPRNVDCGEKTSLGSHLIIFVLGNERLHVESVHEQVLACE